MATPPTVTVGNTHVPVSLDCGSKYGGYFSPQGGSYGRSDVTFRHLRRQRHLATEREYRLLSRSRRHRGGHVRTPGPEPRRSPRQRRTSRSVRTRTRTPRSAGSSKRTALIREMEAVAEAWRLPHPNYRKGSGAPSLPGMIYPPNRTGETNERENDHTPRTRREERTRT